MSTNKIIKGKRPDFFSTSGVDYLMHMVTVLAQEHSAMRDRLDTLESVAAANGLLSREDVECYTPSQKDLERREANRQKFLSNLFSVLAQEAAEVSNADTRQRFEQVINDLATQT